MTSAYTISGPIDELPPPIKPCGKSRDNWSYAYQAARAAHGRWVAIDFGIDTLKARNLSAVARKRHDFDTETRGAVCFMRLRLR